MSISVLTVNGKVVSISEMVAILQKEEQMKAEPKQSAKVTEIFKQLGLTMEALNKELTKCNPSDERLEYYYNKINILESHL